MKNSVKNSVQAYLGLTGKEVASHSQRCNYLRISVNIALPATLIFAAFNILSGLYTLATIEFLSGVIFLLPTFWLRKSPSGLSISEYLVLLYGLSITSALVIYGGIAGSGILWIFAFPFLAFLLKGQRIGWLACISWIAVIHLTFSYGSLLENAYQYEAVFSQQSYAAMIFFTMIAASFNLVRSQFEARLDKKVKLNTEKAEHYLQRLQYLALHDSITDLPNRTHALQKLTDLLTENQAASDSIIVVMLRLERFTELSNILGENGCNELITSVAGKLNDVLGKKGLLAHDRQDEYIYIFKSSETISHTVISDRLGDLPLSFEIDGFQIHIEYKMGASAFPDHAQSAEELLNKAEQALLQAETHGKNIALYDDELRNHFVRRHMLFGKLKHALQNDELQLYFQAKVDMQSRQVIGVEALARWIDSQGQFISPEEFIPVAENSGLIKPFTDWVIKESFMRQSQWRRNNINVKMSINLSIRNIIDPDIVPLLKKMLEEYDVPAQSIVLEITESSFSDSRELILAKVRELNALGFKQSIDDFGTGYSSFSYLKDLRVDELKIDQSFVRNLLVDSRTDAIVTSIIQIAHNLDLSIVAEGIENEDIASWLANAGVDIGQGYHFSKPLPNADFIAFYASQAE